jgi:hypothetical protein
MLPMRACVAAATQAQWILRRGAGRRFILRECGDTSPQVDIHE